MATVALCNYEYPPHCGGGGVFTRDLAAALRRRDHDVRVVADRRDGATATTARLLSWPVRSLPAATRAAAAADVLNAHFAVPTSVALPPVTAATATPLVVNLMGADVYDPTRYERVRPLLDATLAHWIGRAADALVVPSQDMARRVPDRLQPKTHVIPYFVDHSRFHRAPVDASPPLRLLTVARLVERKQLALGLDALSRTDDVTWTIAGSGPERDRLAEAAEARDVADRVTFAGYVPDDDLPALYRAHDAFLFPSKHEAFGIAAVEAMASGLPVIATDTGGHAEVARGPGEVARADAAGIAEAIGRVNTDLHERAHAARERVLERYTAAAVVPQYERLYAEVGA